MNKKHFAFFLFVALGASVAKGACVESNSDNEESKVVDASTFALAAEAAAQSAAAAKALRKSPKGKGKWGFEPGKKKSGKAAHNAWNRARDKRAGSWPTDDD